MVAVSFNSPFPLGKKTFRKLTSSFCVVWMCITGISFRVSWHGTTQVLISSSLAQLWCKTNTLDFVHLAWCYNKYSVSARYPVNDAEPCDASFFFVFNWTSVPMCTVNVILWSKAAWAKRQKKRSLTNCRSVFYPLVTQFLACLWCERVGS